jgi:hypothetical protein
MKDKALRYADTNQSSRLSSDVYQHVNNARYLEFLEEARWDGLESSPAFTG